MAPGFFSRIYNTKLDVQLPKSVKIENTRLRILQVALQVVVAAAALTVFVVSREYLEVRTPQGYPTSWAEPPDTNTFNAATSTDMQREFCASPDSLHYKYSDIFTYVNFDCIIMSTSELFYKVGRDIIYFPTYFHEQWEETASDLVGVASPTPCEALISGLPLCSAGEWLGSACYNLDPCPDGSACTQTCSTKRKKHFFTAGVESMIMAFTHFFQVEGPSGIVSGYSTSDVETSLANHHQPILTIIYSQEMSPSDQLVNTEFDCNKPEPGQCRFEPANPVSLTIKDWLKAANVDLDVQNTQARGNRWNIASGGPKYAYPLNRITGAEIMISTQYDDSQFHNFRHVGEWGWKWPYTICKVLVKGHTDWTGMPQNRYEKLSDAGDENSGYKMRQRWYEGVRFVFTSSTASRWGFPTLSQLSVYLASTIVYMGLVGQIVTLLAVYGLGVTSVAYYKSQQEPLRLRLRCAQGLPSRLIQSATTFYMLAALEAMGEKGVGITAKGMKDGFSYETLHSVFKHIMSAYSEIDHKELRNMSRTVFTAISKDGIRVHMADFCEATSSNESFDMLSMISAFDTDRKKGFLERLFYDAAGVSSKKVDDESSASETSPKVTHGGDSAVAVAPRSPTSLFNRRDASNSAKTEDRSHKPNEEP